MKKTQKKKRIEKKQNKTLSATPITKSFPWHQTRCQLRASSQYESTEYHGQKHSQNLNKQVGDA
jgi:hypothetical protein